MHFPPKPLVVAEDLGFTKETKKREKGLHTAAAAAILFTASLSRVVFVCGAGGKHRQQDGSRAAADCL
ncbi:hypothetical protein scyTo_0007660 [Scyliorhinus torazame]|uniref:Uncharacterized protein n=1 Tax=Scyliorhinus torazame TaxID=75743 RepID=A0A401NWB6_SCYTO|nr:hypothetical protein [Scyliorhinus torazame]